MSNSAFCRLYKVCWTNEQYDAEVQWFLTRGEATAFRKVKGPGNCAAVKSVRIDFSADAILRALNGAG
jgi:hypothetical protein